MGHEARELVAVRKRGCSAAECKEPGQPRGPRETAGGGWSSPGRCARDLALKVLLHFEENVPFSLWPAELGTVWPCYH